ncbi:cytosolic carboxypeptidase 2 [Cephus cinctus]|uniref:Cytosolic carboxypeptidase 2 n=1 Tax=Cephus cinctus TaxID=211228 RepID=A0AAJ7W173_CEPCN|nr:cytosolic carboxypeptidase 2 [Cephus cinctus]
MDFAASSRVKELQAALFPVQPIPGSFITSHCLQGRFGLSKRDVDSSLTLSSAIGKYRESKDQAQITSDSHSALDSIIQEARWPTECQVIQEKVQHIEYAPATPEPYYVPTGKEPKPKPIGEDSGSVIFRYCPASATNYFSRSCIGGTILVPEVTPSVGVSTDGCQTSGSGSTNADLQFESRFESGNLGKVIKITDTYYQLHLRRDLYTQRHMQWYYFRISNTKSRTIYRLSIVNFCKEDSLYNEGLRPLLYSTKDATMHAIGWRRCGDNITYYRNDSSSSSSSDEERESHTLTFNVSFPHDQDTVYLAHCYPYTYSDLQEYLGKIVVDPMKTRFTKLRLLCRTLAGNNVYYLTVTAPAFNDDARKKKGVVITARVHPGETPSSWMMKGIIDFLTGESNQARELRERFIFKLVPMLNPDGVIVGNNRCSLSGKDLNRQYRTVMRESYPSVWHTKLMIRRLMEERGMAIYCDLHAHSRKHNIFIYGCESKRAGCYGKLSEQVFPLMLHKNAADKFSFENCKFHIEKGKEGTGRVVVWLMGIQNSYTMEASLGGSKIGSRAGTHFSTQDYEQIGKAFCETLLDFSDDDPTKERLRNKIIARLMKEGSSADEPTNINLTDYSSDEGDTSDSTSDEGKLETMEPIGNTMNGRYDCQYLCVPLPSSLQARSEVPGGSSAREKRMRKKITMDRSPPLPRRLLTRRAVMDLPTTDPGSDLYELSDSAEENYIHPPIGIDRKKEYRIKERFATSSEKDESSKKESTSDSIPLPQIVRPRSLSLGEELVVPKIQFEARQRVRCLQLPRATRNLSPILPRGQVHIQLTTLRQQIWTGVSLDTEGGTEFEIPFSKSPLSWGVSELTSYQNDSEGLLESCSKKLDTLNYIRNVEGRKLKKKSLKKQAKILNAVAVEDVVEDDIQKPIKKKRSRFKRQKAINSNVNVTESSILSGKTDKLDSLKLIGIAKLPKAESKRKVEPRKKFRKGGLIATVATNVPKTKGKVISETFEESSSSDDAPMGKPKILRKKKKRSCRKKQASSANLVLEEAAREPK